MSYSDVMYGAGGVIGQSIPVATPFIVCKIGPLVLGNYGLGYNEKGEFIDPRNIKSITVDRQANAEGFSLDKLVSILKEYADRLNAKTELESSEKLGYTTKAELEKAAKEKKERVEKERKEANSNLNTQLDSLIAGTIAGMGGSGITATIAVNYARDLELYRWLYNYDLSQDLKPSVSLRFGIKGFDQRYGQFIERSSPNYQGIISDIQIEDWYNLKISVIFTPSEYLGWDPKLFNKIFKTNPKNPSSTKSNNFKEGETLLSTSEKTRRYSDLVERIAKGLGWDIGEIEPTTLLPEEEEISVNHVDDGPLDYIVSNYCGVKSVKEKGSGKSYNAGAISEKTKQEGYVAFIDYKGKGDNKDIKNFTPKFYYVPKLKFLKEQIEAARVYSYYVMGAKTHEKGKDYGIDNGEVLDFSFTPFSMREAKLNLKKKDGKQSTTQSSINNLEKSSQVYRTEISADTKERKVSYSTKREKESAVQNPITQAVMGSKGLKQIFLSVPYNMTNTWMTGGGTLKIIYNPNIHLLDIILVIVLYPRNDSSRLNIENTADLLHPSSGTYRVMGIQDDISDGGATTTLTLDKVAWPDIDAKTSQTEANKPKQQKEQKPSAQKSQENSQNKK